MRTSNFSFIPPSAFFWVFLISQPLTAQATSIWHVDILTAPAPPPEKGPPLSANATRDLNLLWREIVAIVVAYIAIVIVFLGFLLTIGRRLRQTAQETNPKLVVEMVKSSKTKPARLQNPNWPTEGWSTPTPLSAAESNNMWSPNSKKKGRSFSLPFSTGSKGPASPSSRTGSMSTVDESVVQADRMRAQDEMERLYAAVMEHDAQQAAMAHDPNGKEIQPLSPLEGPPEFRHLRQHQQTDPPLSPLSPRQFPRSHAQPQPPAASLQEDRTSKDSPISPRSERFSRLSNLSFLSSRSRTSDSMPKRLSRNSIRHLPISPPMGSPELNERDYPDNLPLSPRRYAPGPPPLNPYQQAKAKAVHVERADSTTSTKTRAPPPSPLNIRTGSNASSTLPFRAAFNSPLSPPSTKTTIVERRESLLGPSGPRTGVPSTPYTPYMPFTPVTPLTPSRVVTRQQRKRKEKESGPRVQVEDDLVEADDDMWGT